MTIKFIAKPTAWRCSNGPWPCDSTGPRGRWSDGKFGDQCQACVDRMIQCIRKYQAGGNRLWFLGRKKETPKP